MTSWLSRLFGRRASLDRDEVTIEPSGEYAAEVVGESKAQDVLERLAGGRTEDGVEVELAAEISLEGAAGFVVLLDGRAVGRLPSYSGEALAAKLREIGAQPTARVLCRALIVGGWSRDGGEDVGSFGVRLDLGDTSG